jgi:PKD domain
MKPNKRTRRRRRPTWTLFLGFLVATVLLLPCPLDAQVWQNLQQMINNVKKQATQTKQAIQYSAGIGRPVIASVSPILPRLHQTIVIRGRGFGQHEPFNGCSRFFSFEDVPGRWEAGLKVGEVCYGGFLGPVQVYIKSWTDSEIVIGGLPRIPKPGDVVLIRVANAQGTRGIADKSNPYSPVPVATATQTVSDGNVMANTPPPVRSTWGSVPGGPVITSVSPVSSTLRQTIIIQGSGFGQHEPFNGCSRFFMFEDVPGGWGAGLKASGVCVGSFLGPVQVYIKSWTDSEIVIGGLPRIPKPGDVVLIKVANAQGTRGIAEKGNPYSQVPVAWYALGVTLPGQTATSKTGGNSGGSGPVVKLDTPGINGTTVSVNGVATAGTPGATITQLSWNWGDGSPVQTAWFPETHTYTKAGDYTISVIGTNSIGATASAQTHVEVTSSAPGIDTLWISQVVPSANGRAAGQVTLNWNIPNGSACKLSVSPAIQNLNSTIPVTCSGSQIGWTATIPDNSSRYPVQYTVQLTGTVSAASVSSPALSVYALPSLTYGGGTSSSNPFNSLNNDKAYSTRPVLCPLQIGCGIDFGLSDPSTQSGSPNMKCVSGTAKCDGLTVAGVVGWGVLGAVASDYDSLQAKYAPLKSVQSGYTEYLEVRPQVGIVSIDACKAFEGGAGTMPFVQMADSSGDNYYWSPQKPETCANLQAGELGKAIEQAFSFSQELMELPQALQPLIQNQILDAQSKVQIGSAGAQILLDLGNFYSNGLTDSKDILPVSVTAQEQKLPPMTPCTKDSVTPCVPVWQPIVQGGSPYSISVSAGAALFSLGTNGAGSLVIGHSEVEISGLAVPTTALRGVTRPASSGLISIDVSPTGVAEGAQFTVSGTVKNATGGLETGTTVQISASVSGSTLPLTTATTSSNGTFSAVLNAPPVTGSVVITATVQGTSPPVQGKATLNVTGNQ